MIQMQIKTKSISNSLNIGSFKKLFNYSDKTDDHKFKWTLFDWFI